ncbi:hypothetical protein HYR99_06445 [Candidatus Poribacteria bacterium]|nr:hypothetical protein [Candidatus Poribacteria bacterium]
MSHTIQILSDGQAAWKEIFRFMRKYQCDVTFVRENVYIVPQVILDELSKNGVRYETATLTTQESKEFQILSFLEKRLLS